MFGRYRRGESGRVQPSAANSFREEAAFALWKHAWDVLKRMSPNERRVVVESVVPLLLGTEPAYVPQSASEREVAEALAAGSPAALRAVRVSGGVRGFEAGDLARYVALAMLTQATEPVREPRCDSGEAAEATAQDPRLHGRGLGRNDSWWGDVGERVESEQWTPDAWRVWRTQDAGGRHGAGSRSHMMGYQRYHRDRPR